MGTQFPSSSELGKSTPSMTAQEEFVSFMRSD